MENGLNSNMHWSAPQVHVLTSLMQPMPDKEGLKEVKIISDKPSNCYRFSSRNYEDGIADNQIAQINRDSITLNGFYFDS